MEYRVVCIEPGRERELGRFESAYAAVDYIAAARGERELGILDGDDTLLFAPDDLHDIELGEAA